eukprot:CAMPEP_0197043206 /NCGR_PEP_ID=MMETSP1384-20130603/19482_1 /TAXON_ID=29189 /ORGANISM="Ammonia sp." /LENGTH=157 /DNA_ID=CAMNT_0042474463 /DNA_START=110 /DNA_END=583 /DNA_ORIENTATION=+
MSKSQSYDHSIQQNNTAKRTKNWLHSDTFKRYCMHIDEVKQHCKVHSSKKQQHVHTQWVNDDVVEDIESNYDAHIDETDIDDQETKLDASSGSGSTSPSASPPAPQSFGFDPSFSRPPAALPDLLNFGRQITKPLFQSNTSGQFDDEIAAGIDYDDL